jgi:integrase/recombinase XerD
MSSATALVVLDPRRKTKDGKYPLKLRITFNRSRRYYGLGMHLTESDFSRVREGNRLNIDERENRTLIQQTEEKAKALIGEISNFSFEIFEKRFNGEEKARKYIVEAYQEVIDELTQNEQLGTASNYRCAINSLKQYKGNIMFLEVTPDYLKGYEKWMKANEKSPTTISMYLRTLRTILNKAIHQGLLPASAYPFGRYSYTVPASRNIKKALLLKDIGLIYNYQPTNESQATAKDYWIFSYLCNGMNIKDIALLTWSDIRSNTIEYERAKTANTKQVKDSISIPLTNEAKQIIDQRSIASEDPKNFIFPILNKAMSASDKKRAVQQCVQNINKNMKRISKALDIKENITTYTARHSFATVLMKSGASTEMIGEALGHSDVKTTKRYLGSFEDSTKQNIYKALTDFNN